MTDENTAAAIADQLEVERHARLDRIEDRLDHIAAEVAEAAAIVARLVDEGGTSTNADTGR